MTLGAAVRQAGWHTALPALLLLLGAGLGFASLGVAAQHPVLPLAGPVATLLLAFGIAVRPQILWFLLPAALPVMSFAPWTGWWLLDESDVMVLACLGGAFVRWGHDLWHAAPRGGKRFPTAFATLWCALALSLLVGVSRGLSDAGGIEWGAVPQWDEAMYAGYDSPWNTWRVAKSMVWALLLGLLLHAPTSSAVAGIPRWVARGMVAGLGLVCIVALWERVVYVGLLDFSRAYRTSAWFWEMHVGGGAIDAYLAMAVPFAAWAMWTSPTAWRWAGATAMLVLSVYVVLTTYSRGVYLAVLMALLFMGMTAWLFKLAPSAGPAWARRSLFVMASTLLFESARVLGGGSFMADRLAQSDSDLVGRMQHWRSGMHLLQTPTAWTAGLGLGRFPSHYSREVAGGDYPGAVLWRKNEMQQPHVLLSGGRESGQRADLFALAQRIDLNDAGPVRVRLRASVEQPSKLLVSVCERHLLYEFSCQRRWIGLKPVSDAGSGWVELRMGPSIFEGRKGVARWRESVLALSPEPFGQTIRVESVELWDSKGAQRLLNADFSQGLQHWLLMAQGQFQPWHVDNLYLDVLIDRGLFGLFVFALWVLWALNHLWRRRRHGDSEAWVMGASLLGILILGAVISVTEVPRVSLILMILLWSSCGFRGQIEDVSRRNKL